MRRPFLIRIAPTPLKVRLVHRLYLKQSDRWPDLFNGASLHFLPRIKMTLCPTDISHKYIALAGYCELDLTRRILYHARTGGLLVDVGANYGYYSLLWAASKSTNKSIAFEASPRAFKGLANNVKTNDLETQIQKVSLAVGKSVGTSWFAPGPADQTSWGGITFENSESRMEVAVTTLDAYFSAREPIDVLKIDVEGADSWVLQGAEQLLSKKLVKHIYFEQNKVRMKKLGISEEEALTFLNRLDYWVKPMNDIGSHLVEYVAGPK